MPVVAPRVNVPIPLASTVRPVLPVDAVIRGLAPENVSAVEVNVLVFIVPSTTKLPLEEMSPVDVMVVPVPG